MTEITITIRINFLIYLISQYKLNTKILTHKINKTISLMVIKSLICLKVCKQKIISRNNSNKIKTIKDFNKIYTRDNSNNLNYKSLSRIIQTCNKVNLISNKDSLIQWLISIISKDSCSFQDNNLKIKRLSNSNNNKVFNQTI